MRKILGEKLADKVTRIIGSWAFISFQICFLVIWIILNVIGWIKHWDPYPFILLNLALSIQAAFAGPVILMSQNRSTERDRRKAEMDFATDKRAEKGVQEIQKHLYEIEKKIDEALNSNNTSV